MDMRQESGKGAAELRQMFDGVDTWNTLDERLRRMMLDEVGSIRPSMPSVTGVGGALNPLLLSRSDLCLDGLGNDAPETRETRDVVGVQLLQLGYDVQDVVSDEIRLQCDEQESSGISVRSEMSLCFCTRANVWASPGVPVLVEDGVQAALVTMGDGAFVLGQIQERFRRWLDDGGPVWGGPAAVVETTVSWEARDLLSVLANLPEGR